MNLINDPEQGGNPAGRKFDDVASLFGSIVPAPGSPVRPSRPFTPLPVALPEPSGPTIVPPPPSEPEAIIPQEAVELPAQPPALPAEIPALRVEPKVAARPRPTEIPWPDAFEPRPNYKKPEPRNWSWLLVIPVGIVAAVGVSLIDTRTLRLWIDANLLHRTPAVAIDSPLLPAPFRTDAPQNPTPQPEATPAPEPPNPYPAIPTSPVPVPEGTEVSPPPVDPTQAAAASPLHVTIQYRRNIPGADGEARRMAALLQSTGGSVETRPNATTVKTPTITYYNAADKESASALALILANEATHWTVRLGTTKNPLGSIDVSLP